MTTQHASKIKEIAKAIALTVRQVGEAPSGPIYAHLMGEIDLSTYEYIIHMLKQLKLIREENNVLIWIGDRAAANN